ncbi:hypothetical protein RB195_021819 [Necator americanus]|uniref:Phlebovirus glycoprotein G2 fusion domain-containing protein n=1 Tax=Necator americanus TaxID=51031 RepID=A0ABR1ED16_NECAM
MLTEFDDTCRCIRYQINLKKKMLMREGWFSDAPFTLNGKNVFECTSNTYLHPKINMTNDLTCELGRRRRAAWGACDCIKEIVKRTMNILLRGHLFNTAVVPALIYASEM